MDRVLVFREHELFKEFDRSEVTRERARRRVLRAGGRCLTRRTWRRRRRPLARGGGAERSLKARLADVARQQHATRSRRCCWPRLFIATRDPGQRQLRPLRPARDRGAGDDRGARERAGDHRRRVRPLDLAAASSSRTACTSSGSRRTGSAAPSPCRSCSASVSLTGLFTGLMITILRVQPVVVTLAMYFALQGVDLLLAPNPVSLGEQHRWIYDLAGRSARFPARSSRSAHRC